MISLSSFLYKFQPKWRGIRQIAVNNKLPSISIVSPNELHDSCECKIEFVTKENDKLYKLQWPSHTEIQDLKPNAEFSRLLYPGERSKEKRTFLVGLGSEQDLTLQRLQDSVHNALASVKRMGLKQTSIVLESMGDLDFNSSVSGVAQVASLANYSFEKYVTKSDLEAPQNELNEVKLIVESQNTRLHDIVKDCLVVGESVSFARDLVNERGDDMTPNHMEEFAKQVAEEHGLSMTVIRGRELEEKGLRLLHAVGQAGSQEPRLVILEYKGDKTGKCPLSLIGKGVTFDTGGLNLKPTNYIEDMYMDMAGSAAVLGAIHGIAKMNLEINVVAALALAENAIDSRSYKPHAIIKSHFGHTVEIGNTDAEGRLALADAMSFVQKEHKPQIIVDVATLTGACIVALGEQTAGLFGNEENLIRMIEEAGLKWSEQYWHLPILPDHINQLKPPGKQADIRSIGAGREAGASTAAAFLQEFVNKPVKWAHLDIAGPAMASKPWGFMPKGGTGFATPTLIELAKKLQHSFRSSE